ncbi:MAG: glycogen/starch synthase [Bacteroidota bacterium]
MEKTIVHLTSEIAPFYKRGGLGDVAGSLPVYLTKKYRNVVISFYYKGRMKGLEDVPKRSFIVDIHGIDYRFYYYPLVRDNVQYFFIDMDDENLFSESEGGSLEKKKKTKRGNSKGDTAYRGLLPIMIHFYFAKAALNFILKKEMEPSFLLLHDWQVAGVFAYQSLLRHMREQFNCKTLMMIHNFQYQGEIIKDSLSFLDAESRETVRSLYDKYESASLMGLAFDRSDYVATVSNGYAKELEKQSAPHIGYDFVAQRTDGILHFTNGVDYSLWHPKNSPFLPIHYDIDQQAVRKRYKAQLQRKCGFEDDGKPIALMMARLVPQKGIYLFMNTEQTDERALAQIEKVLDTGVKLIVHGTPAGGEDGRVNYLFELARKTFPDRFYYDNKYSDAKGHVYLAGSDMALMPSFFEPCGLVQLYAMAFGSVPIVNPVGGLGDTVDCFFKEENKPTGFHMESYSTTGLVEALQRAADIYHNDKNAWQELINNGMNADFSWDRMIQPYFEFFAKSMQLEYST